MCKIKIREKTIAAIKLDIIEIEKEISDLHHFEHYRRSQKLRAIKYNREIIEDLEKRKA